MVDWFRKRLHFDMGSSGLCCHAPACWRKTCTFWVVSEFGHKTFYWEDVYSAKQERAKIVEAYVQQHCHAADPS